MVSLEEKISRIPKVEQHIHIVGSIRPETIRWLIEENGIESELTKYGDVRRALEFEDFPQFIQRYVSVRDCIRAERQFERIIHEILEDEAERNVRYVEATLSPLEHTLRWDLDYFEMMKSIRRGIEKARMDFGIECKLKIDLVRDFGPEVGKETLGLISEYGEEVVAIDLGGSEHLYPPKPFMDVYKMAREIGLHLTAHAGEVGGPKNVWDAVKYLEVERIGHGVTARKDEKLIAYLRRKKISVEACPTSNVLTGIVKSIKEHPIRLFFDRGLNVTVNSDDPTLFKTDINREFIKLHEELGFTLQDLIRLSLNAVESSFLEEEDKSRLMKEFHREIEDIQ